MHSITRYFWAIPFLSFMTGYYIIKTMYSSQKLKTPHLIGKNLSATAQLLAANNLNIRILGYKEDNDLPDNTVISQNPDADRPVKSNQSVYLVLSKKPDTVMVPACGGKSLSDIEQEALKKEITVTPYFIQSTYPKNHCVGQLPSPGTALEKKELTVYLSAGNKKPVIMPNFKNKPVSQVLEFLNRHGMICQLFHIHHQPDDHQCDSCIVTDQRPFAGSLITLSEEKPLYVQIQAR